MKISPLRIASILSLTIVFTSFYSFKSKEILPDNYVGDWKSGPTEITLRKKTGFMRYKFTKLVIQSSVLLERDNFASGKIGNAGFKKAVIKINKGNFENTGIVYIIKCGQLKKIESADDSTGKEIELWIKPIKIKGQLDVELRQKQGLDAFPMGEIHFSRK